MSGDLLRRLPSVKDLLESQPLKYVAEQLSQNVVVDGIRSFFEHLRSQVQAAAEDLEIPGPDDLARQIANWILSEDHARLRPVINATGLLLSRDLGSPLAKESLEETRQIGEGYLNLDLDLATGGRIERSVAVAPLLTQLTGAEGALVVNSHAGATLLAIAALAGGKEVVVSRGEVVEIGANYSVPQILQMSGASIREVGATNATRIADFATAIQDRAAAILRVDPMSFASGATERPSLAELISLARERRVPLVDDIGLGSAVDVTPHGLTGFPSAAASVAAGADLVIFRGDGLLGGPACGIIVGRRELIDRIARHPMAAPLQVNSLTLAALAAALRQARDPAEAKRLNSLVGLITTSLENLRNRAERLAPQIAAAPAIASAEALPGETHLESTSVPGQKLATMVIAVVPREGTVEDLAKRLRTGQISVVGRIEGGRLLIDIRSVFPRQDIDLVSAFEQLS